MWFTDIQRNLSKYFTFLNNLEAATNDTGLLRKTLVICWPLIKPKSLNGSLRQVLFESIQYNVVCQIIIEKKVSYLKASKLIAGLACEDYNSCTDTYTHRCQNLGVWGKGLSPPPPHPPFFFLILKDRHKVCIENLGIGTFLLLAPITCMYATPRTNILYKNEGL